MEHDTDNEKVDLMSDTEDGYLETRILRARCCDRCLASCRDRYRSTTIAVTAMLLCLAVAGTAFLSVHSTFMGCPSLAPSPNDYQMHSPVDGALRYKTQLLETHDSQSSFSGKPRPEFDDAWYDLLYYTNIRVTADELRAANQTSIKLKDSEHYIAYLEVYHQLHCIKRMVQTRYPEYYPDLVARGKLSDAHFDHCIEVLRLSTMCRADTSLATLHWNSSGKERVVAASASRRQCVDWEYLTEWTKERFTGERFEFEMIGDEAVIGPST